MALVASTVSLAAATTSVCPLVRVLARTARLARRIEAVEEQVLHLEAELAKTRARLPLASRW